MGLLGYAVGFGADCSGDVGSVAVAVGVAVFGRVVYEEFGAYVSLVQLYYLFFM